MKTAEEIAKEYAKGFGIYTIEFKGKEFYNKQY